ncbi:MAG: hypothetical protein RL383_962 [Actinomycetota bacterium]
MHVLLATDAQWVADEVIAALGSPSTSFTVVTNGRKVCRVVEERTPDLVIVDMQVGTMGGMAITMDLRLEASAGVLPEVPVLMLLDREMDIHMARRSGSNGWVIKPLDPLRLQRAAEEVAVGGCYSEGLPSTGEQEPQGSGSVPADSASSDSADSLVP